MVQNGLLVSVGGPGGGAGEAGWSPQPKRQLQREGERGSAPLDVAGPWRCELALPTLLPDQASPAPWTDGTSGKEDQDDFLPLPSSCCLPRVLNLTQALTGSTALVHGAPAHMCTHGPSRSRATVGAWPGAPLRVHALLAGNEPEDPRAPSQGLEPGSSSGWCCLSSTPVQHFPSIPFVLDGHRRPLQPGISAASKGETSRSI
ncbi:uncharacterized protein LOC115279749 [Suricata suricatta]|uniref:uncharacterized protein LOC115279749 n=1 Tax=Suricata suricatta TaxID=37032 RepID=UPI0011553301|nr:uncharacterized protein LOC115279749 [Suricata suricatta]